MLLPAVTSKIILSNLIAAILRLFALSSLACALIALLALHPTYLQAQEPTADDDVVRVNTDLFVIPIRVKDKRKQASIILTERDLLLKDDDQVTSGLSLYHGADRVAVVFALDQSGSLRQIISQQREAALALAGRFGDRSQVAVIRFAEKPSLAAPFAKDISAAREAFALAARANQHTAIFDAAAAAANAFEGLPQVRSERRLVVLISDGLDNASSIKADSVVEAALRNHVSFYVIHLPLFEPRDGRLAVRSPTKGFKELAEKTGGKYFLVGNASAALVPQTNGVSNDLTPIFRAIEEDLRSQYLLGFYFGAGARDGRSHHFTIGLPAGFEYQIGFSKYSRTHDFSHVMPAKSDKAP